MKFLADSDLYTRYDYYAEHFSWPAPSPNDTDLLRFHCLWKGGPITRHHLLCIKSLLLTQSPPYEIWLWVDPAEPAGLGPLFSELKALPHVFLRHFCLEREIQQTRYEQYRDLLTLRDKGDPASDTDKLRLFATGLHGGIYFDLDTLFLKDLRPLCTTEFCYQWSDMPYATNAISYIRQDSPTVDILLTRAREIRTLHPARLLRFEPLQDVLDQVLVFPSFVFDPVWIAHDHQVKQNAYCNTFDDFFLQEMPVTLSDFFPASFAYQWHNRWQVPILPKTIVGQLYDEVLVQYAARFG